MKLIDRIYELGDEQPVRLISYPTKPKYQPDLETLTQSGLALGEIFSHDPKIVTYKVPQSSRPVRYDAALGDFAGAQSFSDQELFLSAGIILGAVSRLFVGRSIRRETPIGQTFSVIDFVSEGDPHLFLTPGVERLLIKGVPASEDDYVDRMCIDFPNRFNAHEREFITGFQDGLLARQ